MLRLLAVIWLASVCKTIVMVALVAKPMDLWKLPAISVNVIANALLVAFALLVGQSNAIISLLHDPNYIGLLDTSVGYGHEKSPVFRGLSRS
jgi:hypothetical protein